MSSPKPTSKPGASERERAEDATRAVVINLKLNALTAAGIPLRHRERITDDGTSAGWLAKRADIADRLGSGFLIALLGNRGTGKTQLAVDIIRSVIAKQKDPFELSNKPPAVYARAMDVFLHIKSAYSNEGMTEAAALKRFIRPQLLVIDEAQERGQTDWENRLLTHILDVRYGDEKDTLLIGNQTEAAFKQSIGESIWSRLVETGGVVLCDWESFRSSES